MLAEFERFDVKQELLSVKANIRLLLSWDVSPSSLTQYYRKFAQSKNEGKCQQSKIFYCRAARFFSLRFRNNLTFFLIVCNRGKCSQDQRCCHKRGRLGDKGWSLAGPQSPTLSLPTAPLKFEQVNLPQVHKQSQFFLRPNFFLRVIGCFKGLLQRKSLSEKNQKFLKCVALKVECVPTSRVTHLSSFVLIAKLLCC